MLYLVHMAVRLPDEMISAAAEELKAREKTRSLELQRSGIWRHLWRVAGQYANYSVFEVASNDELHDLLVSLPLFPYMTIEVIPLASHPSSLSR